MQRRWRATAWRVALFSSLFLFLLLIACNRGEGQATSYVIGYYTLDGQSNLESGSIPFAEKTSLRDPALLEQRVIELVNKRRIQEGLLPLKRNETLVAAARAHSWDMARYDFFSHVSFDGLELLQRLQRAGYTPTEHVAENIAAGFASAESTVEAWIQSYPHRNNILHPDLREIGVGYFYERDDRFGPYYHYWTVHLGARQHIYPVVIESDSFSTTSRAVKLYIHGQGWARDMAIANDAPVPGTEWEPYQPIKEWWLSSRLGDSCVYVTLQSSTGQTCIVSDTISLQGHHACFQQGMDGYEGASDTYITSWAPNTNYIRAKSLPARSDSAKEVLLHFDLRSVPTRATVLQVMLRLYILRGGPQPMTINVHRLLRPWNVRAVTWGRAAPGVLWDLPGAYHAGTDREVIPLAQVVVDRTDIPVALDITPLAQAWIASPETNFGLLLTGAGGGATEYAFASAEQWRANLRPMLELIWLPEEPPRPTPTPTGEITSVPSATPSPSATASPTSTLTPGPSPTPLTVVFQYGVDRYYGATDTYLSAWAQEENYAGSGTLHVRSDDAKTALLHFDIRRIPRDANVLRAVLSLYVVSGGRHPIEINAYGVMRPWDAKQATWLWPLVGDSWGVPGCNGPGSDRIPFPADTVRLTGAGKWVDWDVTSLVVAWIADPDLNDGFVLKGGGSVSVQYSFASAEHWKPVERPRLTVTYASSR